ncbi:MAG TPA: sigma-70 family RNA polymerase sigma factor [Bacillota bacterium]|nr:sigma-70 family RNA polymerase sigma factor [Bacillota bacterium]
MTESEANRHIESYIVQYGARLSRLCFSLCKNYHDAEDLYQETWLKVSRKIMYYDSSKPFDRWLFSVCVNCFRDSLRRRTPLCEFDSTDHMERFFESLPDLSTEEKQDYSVLYAAMATLTADERTAVSLFYFDDYDGKAAASIMGVSSVNFRVMLARARKKLKGTISDE